MTGMPLARSRCVAVAVVLALPLRAAAAQVPSAGVASDSGCFVRAALRSGDTSRTVRDSSRTVRDPAVASSPAARGPTIVLFAAASAREVRFASQPTIAVRLCGAVFDTVRVLERRNLPDPVQPGTTYRDVYVAVEVLGYLRVDCLKAERGTDSTARVGLCAVLRDTLAARRSP